MKKTNIYLLSILLLCSFTGMLFSQTLEPVTLSPAKTKSKGMSPSMQAGLRSLLFPGLGQLKNEQRTKGYIFLGIGAVLLGTTVYMGISQNSLWNDYAASRTRADYDSYKTRVHTANIFIGITSAFWIYNVVDAYLVAKSKAGTVSSEEASGSHLEKSSGTQIEADYIKCPKCGLKVKKGSSFCPKCGTKLD